MAKKFLRLPTLLKQAKPKLKPNLQPMKRQLLIRKRLSVNLNVVAGQRLKSQKRKKAPTRIQLKRLRRKSQSQ